MNRWHRHSWKTPPMTRAQLYALVWRSQWFMWLGRVGQGASTANCGMQTGSKIPCCSSEFPCYEFGISLFPYVGNFGLIN